SPAESAAQMASDFAALFGSQAWASAIMVAGLLALGVALVHALRAHRAAGERAAPPPPRPAAAVFIAGAVLLPLAAGIALGRHTGLDSFRYAQTLLLALLPLAWWLADALTRLAGARIAWAAFATLALATAVATLRLDTSERALH